MRNAEDAKSRESPCLGPQLQRLENPLPINALNALRDGASCSDTIGCGRYVGSGEGDVKGERGCRSNDRSAASAEFRHCRYSAFGPHAALRERALIVESNPEKLHAGRSRGRSGLGARQQDPAVLKRCRQAIGRRPAPPLAGQGTSLPEGPTEAAAGRDGHEAGALYGAVLVGDDSGQLPGESVAGHAGPPAGRNNLAPRTLVGRGGRPEAGNRQQETRHQARSDYARQAHGNPSRANEAFYGRPRNPHERSPGRPSAARPGRKVHR